MELERKCRLHSRLLDVVIVLVCAQLAACDLQEELVELRDSVVPRAGLQFREWAENVLGTERIQKAYEEHAERDRVRKINASEEFASLMLAVEQRVSGVEQALNAFATELELSFQQPSPRPPAPPSPCCSLAPPQSYSYQWRHRQSVGLQGVCLGTARDSQDPGTVWAEKAFALLKENYQNNSAILWQYYAGVGGQFVQFPEHSRHCDPDQHVVSPLTERWFADKLERRRVNLVLVVDAGQDSLVSTSPRTPHNALYAHVKAVRETLDTLLDSDRVNVVTVNGSGPVVWDSCAERLLVANQNNRDILGNFCASVHPGGNPNYTAALESAYQLLLQEKSLEKDHFAASESVIMLLTDSAFKVVDSENLLRLVDNFQNQMNRSVRHFVHVLQMGADNGPDYTLLSQLADLNNHQIRPDLSAWPLPYSAPVGPPGYFEVTQADMTDDFVDGVATFYSHLPHSVAMVKTTDLRLLASPTLDNQTGLLSTFSKAVYNGSSLAGVVAMDASMGSLFSSLTDFRLGTDSYAFLIDSDTGRVLLHPKLAPAWEARKEDPVFPRLDVVEPTLTSEQREQLQKATFTRLQIQTKVSPGRSSYGDGGEASSPRDATLLYARVGATPLVAVLVAFQHDLETIVPTQHSLYEGATYHRVDVLSKGPQPPQSCSRLGSFILYNASTVKMAPWVFKRPLQYRYSTESTADVIVLNTFLSKSGSATSLLRDEYVEPLKHDLRVTGTVPVDSMWEPTAHEVIERFMGTSSGFLRVYPGIPLNNNYDHTNQLWYKRSVRSPDDLVFTPGKFGFHLNNDVIILSRALWENKGNQTRGDVHDKVHGVVAATLTHTHLVARLLNKIPLCTSSEYQCDLVTEEGSVLGSEAAGPDRLHLTMKFPWLARVLLQRKVVEPRWCTALSDGEHRLSYWLQQGNFTHEPNVTDLCRHFLLQHVEQTTLFVLITRKGCAPDQICEDCMSVPDPSLERKCVRCWAEEITDCACPCKCLSDFDSCTGAFAKPSPHFPRQTCYDVPEDGDLPQTRPEAPGPIVALCPQLCVAISEQADCESEPHCQWTNGTYPVCAWRQVLDSSSTTPGTETPPVPDYSTTADTSIGPTHTPGGSTSGGFSPTSLPPGMTSGGSVPSTQGSTTPQPAENTAEPSQGSSSPLSGGAIAGIVLAVLVVVGVAAIVGVKYASRKVARRSSASDIGVRYQAHTDLRTFNGVGTEQIYTELT